MSGTATHYDAAAGGPRGPEYEEALDPANQSLAEALRKSFRILKLLMLVLVVLYFLSGWFSVKPSDVGVILRFGRIQGAEPGRPAVSAVLPPGWHWSWPYPFERWETVSSNEREIPIEFLFQLSEAEETGGIKGYKYNDLSPLRDDYLITGDVNILHASVSVKYKIKDAVAYLTNVSPMPDPEAGPRSADFRRYPEYTVMTNLVRNAVIETAAKKEALQVRGSGQKEFLENVAIAVNQKLKALEDAGIPLGIEVDPGNGIVSPQKGSVEAIMPPRQVQEMFDRTFAAQTEKSVAITKASSEAQAMLLQTAGTVHEEVAAAVQREFELMLKLRATETDQANAAAAAASGQRPADVEAVKAELKKQRQATEALLDQSSGEVQTVLNNAKIKRDEIIKEASGDYARFMQVLPEYLDNPTIFMSRFLDDVYARALESRDVAKVFVPPDAKEWWLEIPRSATQEAAEATAGEKGHTEGKTELYGTPKPKRPK
ncbi:MAG TPA: SPFH domain-containing protein [Phycisphaerae bacterium]|nr:SPFH domain-containing protein [Phycisphaerae bacterium]